MVCVTSTSVHTLACGASRTEATITAVVAFRTRGRGRVRPASLAAQSVPWRRC